MKSKKSKEYLAALASITALSHSVAPHTQALETGNPSPSHRENLHEESGVPAGSLSFSEPTHLNRTASSGTLNIWGNSASESAGSSSLAVERADCGSSGSIVGAASVDYYTRSVTASPMQDYTPVNGSLEWGSSGDCSTKFITVPVTDDTIYETEYEYLEVILDNPQGASLGSSGALLYIRDDDTRTVLTAPSTISESATAITANLSREGCNRGGIDPASVKFSTKDISAVAGDDYVGSSGSFAWGSSGDCSIHQISIPIIDDTVYEQGRETLELSLSNPQGTSIGSSGTFVAILDNETQTNIAQSVTTSEASGFATLYAFRDRCNWPGISASSVEYYTSDDSALAGQDYTESNGQLSWGSSGDCSYKQIKIPINDDQIYEESIESGMVSLSNGNNTSIGSSGIAYFFIWDNESPDNCAGNNKTIVNRYVPAGHSLKCEDANSIDISDSYVGSSGDMVLSAANGITIREPFHAHYGSTFRASSAPQSVGRDQNGTVSKFNTDLPKNPLRAPLSQKLSESNNVEKQKIESLYDASGLLLSSVADLIFSREGDVIIFSTEDSIHPLDNNTSRDIYLYNTSTGNLTYVSAGLIHPQENGAECSSPFLEDGGQFVVFQLSKEYGRDIDLFMYDLANSVLTRVASLSDQPEDSDPASAPVIDSSATNIAYVKYNHIGDRSIVKHMRLHDGKWVEMARNQKDVGSRESCPTLSRDGRYLAYFEQSNPEEETAQNLVVIDLLNSLYAKQKFTTNDFSPKESRGRFIGNSLYMEWDLVGESSQQRVEFFAPLPSIPLDYHLMEATN